MYAKIDINFSKHLYQQNVQNCKSTKDTLVTLRRESLMIPTSYHRGNKKGELHDEWMIGNDALVMKSQQGVHIEKQRDFPSEGET